MGWSIRTLETTLLVIGLASLLSGPARPDPDLADLLIQAYDWADGYPR